MDPFLCGGHMIASVERERSTWAEIPAKFEAGTLPIAQAIATESYHTAQPIKLRLSSTGVKAGTAKCFQVFRMPAAIAVIEISRI